MKYANLMPKDCIFDKNTFFFHIFFSNSSKNWQLRVLIVEILRQQEVGRQMFILLAGEISLSNQIFRKTQCFQLKKCEKK